jgi:hypothetical protein
MFLSGQDAKDMESVQDMCGEYVARAMCSKNWQLRDAAVVWMTEAMRKHAFEAQGKDAYRTLSRTMLKAMKDKVAAVFLSSLNFLNQLVESYGKCLNKYTRPHRFVMRVLRVFVGQEVYKNVLICVYSLPVLSLTITLPLLSLVHL